MFLHLNVSIIACVASPYSFSSWYILPNGCSYQRTVRVMFHTQSSYCVSGTEQEARWENTTERFSWSMALERDLEMRMEYWKMNCCSWTGVDYIYVYIYIFFKKNIALLIYIFLELEGSFSWKWSVKVNLFDFKGLSISLNNIWRPGAHNLYPWNILEFGIDTKKFIFHTKEMKNFI